MVTAAGFARYLTAQLERLGTPGQLLLTLLVLAFVVAVAVASLLVPSPEPIVVAPFRW